MPPVRLASRKGVTRKALLLAVCGGVSCAVNGSAFAQSAKIEQAVSNTIYEHYDRNGLGSSFKADSPLVQQAWDETRQNVSTSWVDLLKKVVRDVWPFSLLWGDRPCEWKGKNFCGGGGGSFGGGGATGEWSDSPAKVIASCKDFDVKFDPAGRLIAPSIPLPTGGPQSRGKKTVTYFLAWDAIADSQGAAVLFYLNHLNTAKGGRYDDGYWLGVYSIEETADMQVYRWASQSHRRPDGSIEPAVLGVSNMQRNRYHWDLSQTGGNEKSVDCPPDGVSTVDFDFYTSRSTAYQGATNGCTFYAKNFSVAPSGYGYPTHTSIKVGDLPLYIKSNPSMASCMIDPSAIAKIANDVLDRAKKKPGFKGPKTRVTNDEVRNGGLDPRGEQLADAPDPDLPEPTPEPGKAEPPSNFDPAFPELPTKPPTPPGENGYPDNADPALGSPSLNPPELTMPDWFPGLSALSIPIGSGQCPVYQFEAFGYQHTLESHCPLAEQNRALISTIMLVIFTIGAATIVMRA